MFQNVFPIRYTTHIAKVADNRTSHLMTARCWPAISPPQKMECFSPSVIQAYLRVNGVSKPCVCGIEWFSTRTDEDIKGASASLQCLDGGATYISTQPSHNQPYKSAAHQIAGEKYQAGVHVLTVWDVLNGEWMDTLLSNNAGYQRWTKGGGGGKGVEEWTCHTISCTDSQRKHCICDGTDGCQR